LAAGAGAGAGAGVLAAVDAVTVAV
jgi:hypothetical protein